MCIKYFILNTRKDLRNVFVTGFFFLVKHKLNSSGIKNHYLRLKVTIIPVIYLEPVVEYVIVVTPVIASSDPTSIG